MGGCLQRAGECGRDETQLRGGGGIWQCPLLTVFDTNK